MLDVISLIMLALLAVVGAGAVLAFAFSLNINRKRKIAASIVMLFIYILYVVFVGFVYLSFNYDEIILYISVVIFTLAGIGYVIYRCIKERKHMNRLALLLFLIYCAIVTVVTVLMRRGTQTKAVNMIPFSHVMKAVKTGEVKLAEGDILNVILFIPFGFLIPQINRQVLRKAVYAFIFGFAASAMIETIQLLTHLGQCDINDIIANALGAMIGYWIYRVVQGKKQESDSVSAEYEDNP